MSVAAWSKAWVCGHLHDGVAGSNPAWRVDICILELLCVVRGLGVGLIPHQEDSYKVCVFVCLFVRVSLSVIRCNNNRLQLQLIR